MDSSLRTSTVAAISAGAILTGILGYSIYFDHRRRTDPEFRRALKRDVKRQAKAAKAKEANDAADTRRELKALVAKVNAEGFPTSNEQREMFFMECMEAAEKYMTVGDNVSAATQLFKCFKVYPGKSQLIKLLDQTVPKDVLDLLAIMIAQDPSLNTDDDPTLMEVS